MPVAFISSTHFGSPEALGYAGFDADHAGRCLRMLGDGGFAWTLCGDDSTRIDSVTRAQFVSANRERIRP